MGPMIPSCCDVLLVFSCHRLFFLSRSLRKMRNHHLGQSQAALRGKRAGELLLGDIHGLGVSLIFVVVSRAEPALVRIVRRLQHLLHHQRFELLRRRSQILYGQPVEMFE